MLSCHDWSLYVINHLMRIVMTAGIDKTIINCKSHILRIENIKMAKASDAQFCHPWDIV